MSEKNETRDINFNKFVTFLVGLLTLLLVFLTEIVQPQELMLKGKVNPIQEKVILVTNAAVSDSGDQYYFADVSISDGFEHRFMLAQENGKEWFYESRESLAELMAYESAHQNWLVFVHGDGKALPSAVKRAQEIQDLHNINVIVYAWPSKDYSMNVIANFKKSYANIEQSTIHFQQFLQLLASIRQDDNAMDQEEKFTLFLHSLGNYYLERLVKDGLHRNIESKIFDNVIINAAAVEQEGHHAWVEELNFGNRIYINSNDDDFSLSGLRVLTPMGRQLGESALEPRASNAIYIDFTYAVGFNGAMGPSHSYYFAPSIQKSENIKAYYRKIFHGKQANLNNPELFAYLPEQETYAIIY